VTLLTLYNWRVPACEARSRNALDPGLCSKKDVISPLLTVLHANQHGSLRQLLGMPLRLAGVRMEPLPQLPDDTSSMSIDHMSDLLQYTPHVNLSALDLTHLGVSGGLGDNINFDELPQTLVSLSYRAAVTEANVGFSQPCTAAMADVSAFGGSPAVDFTRSGTLDSWHANVEGRSVHMDAVTGPHPILPCRTYTGTRDVRIAARDVSMCHYSCAGEQKIGLEEAFLDLLCPPCMESMDIKSGRDYPTVGQSPGQHDIPDAWRLLMRQMMSAYGSKYAFQIDDGAAKRAAWRRWPAPGTHEHGAARRQHEEAINWAHAAV